MNNVLKSTTFSMESEQPAEACQRVLVAEDDAMFRRILRSWLESWGYQVTLAEDGAKALQILEGDLAPQLLILDWMMPKLNGVELCRLIREQDKSPYQYILLVTAKDDKQDLIRGLEAGADDYLTKPFDKNELRARLRTGRRILTLQDDQTKILEQLRIQATHDGLTAIWNRSAIMEFLRAEFDRAARSTSDLCVLMLDLDHFKRVNDTFGHQAGDAVLKAVARRVQESVRSCDMVGRYGGEEFLILLPGCDGEQLEKCAERIRTAISCNPILAEDLEIQVTASIGAVVADTRNKKAKEALSTADAALYEAKKQGRNRVVCVDMLSDTRVCSADSNAESNCVGARDRD